MLNTLFYGFAENENYLTRLSSIVAKTLQKVQKSNENPKYQRKPSPRVARDLP